MIPKESVGCRQSRAELFGFRVDGTGTAAISFGSKHATLTDNGTGDYTLTFTRPFKQVPVVVATPLTANLMPQIVSVDATAVRLKFVDNDGTPTATDAVFHCLVFGCFNATEY